MPRDLDPIVDNWYAHLDKGQRFKVVAVDEETALVELQKFDGDIEEISLSAWYKLEIEFSEEPENWSGAMDIAEIDDLGTEITETSKEDWSDPQKVFRQPGVEKLTSDEKESVDDWAEGFPGEKPLESEK